MNTAGVALDVGHHEAARDGIVDAARGAELMVGGRAITSFASANYLAFEPPCCCRSSAFGGRQTLGVPASLARDADSTALEAELAAFVGQPSAALGKSTFHLLIDLMQTASLTGPVLVSQASYALTQLAARVLGSPSAISFASLREARTIVARLGAGSRRSRPTFFVDGWSLRGAMPPLAELAEVAARAGGRLVVDDTQALGLLGEPALLEPLPRGLPLGVGGAGTPAFVGLPAQHVVTVASLGKAFGLPLAFAAGPAPLIERLRGRGPLTHASSQPPLALVRAARRALMWNRSAGDGARVRLLRVVAQFRRLPGVTGVPHSPVQRWVIPQLKSAHVTWSRLFEHGIWCLLERDGYEGGALTFLLTAAHEGSVLARALAKLESLWRAQAW